MSLGIPDGDEELIKASLPREHRFDETCERRHIRCQLDVKVESHGKC